MGITKVGPFGGNGGSEWDGGSFSDILQIQISSGSVIDSIQFAYAYCGWETTHGGNGGDKHKIKLDPPNEFITEISGHHGLFDGRHYVVHSLLIRTNLNCYGPYGTPKGDNFSVTSNGGKIVGFFGKSGRFLDAIGAYVSAGTQTIRTFGPFGGLGGHSWDDGVHTKINIIEIHAGEIIDSFRINYIKDGEAKWSRKHGQSVGGLKSVIKLDSNEYVTSISGYHKKFHTFFGILYDYIIASLTIKTNLETYGPFGQQAGTPFEIYGGKIVGFLENRASLLIHLAHMLFKSILKCNN